MATMKKAQFGDRVGRARGQKCGLEKALRKEDRMYEKENRKIDRQADREARREARRAPKYRTGGKVTTAKKGGSFPDLNKDGKITKADILKGRGVIKNGGKLKKAQTGRKVNTTNPYAKIAFEKKKMGFEEKKKEIALKRLRSLPKNKVGGKVSKMMGGGKCRGGCY